MISAASVSGRRLLSTAGKEGIIVSCALLAVFFGVLASTADPTLIGLAVGLIGGIALLAAPGLCVEVLLVVGLTSGFFLSLAGAGSGKIGWGLAVLGLLLLALSLFRLVTSVAGTPGFIGLAVAFMLYSCLTTILQLHSLAEFIAGFKRYFQTLGLALALALLPFPPERYERWLRILLAIAVGQLPFALYERFVLAAARGNGAEATDVVAGTLGANMVGGSANAQMAAFLILALAFLFSRWREGLVRTRVLITLGTLCAIPLGLGETKIVVLMLPVVWAVLVRKDVILRPARTILQMGFVALATIALGSIYVGMNDRSADEVLSETLRYNTGSGGYGQYLLNRSSALSFWWAANGGSDLAAAFFGHGLGSSYSSVSNLVPGHLAVRFKAYGIDLTTASSLLWDTGLLGAALYLAMMAGAWISAARLYRAAGPPAVRADALALQASIAVLTTFVFYDNALVNYLPFEVISAAVLGYLGHLARRHRASSTPQTAGTLR